MYYDIVVKIINIFASLILSALTIWAILLAIINVLEMFNIHLPLQNRLARFFLAPLPTQKLTPNQTAKQNALATLLPNKLTWQHAIAITLIYFAFLFFAIVIFYHVQPDRHEPFINHGTFIEYWHHIYYNNDGNHYYNIATTGYLTETKNGDFYLLAFYPLYPFLCWLATLIFRDFYLSALILDFIFAPLIIYFLWHTVRQHHDHVLSWLVVILFLAFPWSFAMFLSYTENPFILLTILVFYFLGKKKWWLAGLAGFLAALTRTPGVLTCLPIFITLYQTFQFSNFKKYLFAFLPLAGYGFYLILNFALTGNPFYFSFVQDYYWLKSAQSLFTTFPTIIKGATEMPFTWQVGRWIPILFFTTTNLLLIIWVGKKRFSLSHLLYSLAYFGLILCISNPMSANRFFFALWPLFIWQAMLFRTRLQLFLVYLLLTFSLLILFLNMFISTQIVC
jgi:hypothetical protein